MFWPLRGQTLTTVNFLAGDFLVFCRLEHSFQLGKMSLAAIEPQVWKEGKKERGKKKGQSNLYVTQRVWSLCHRFGGQTCCSQKSPHTRTHTHTIHDCTTHTHTLVTTAIWMRVWENDFALLVAQFWPLFQGKNIIMQKLDKGLILIFFYLRPFKRLTFYLKIVFCQAVLLTEKQGLLLLAM